MPEVIKGKFEFKTAGFGARGTYDWESWLHIPENKEEGKVLKFIAGQDFTCDVTSFMLGARSAAATREVGVRINKVVDGCVLQAFKLSEEQLEKLRASKAKKKAKLKKNKDSGEDEPADVEEEVNV